MEALIVLIFVAILFVVTLIGAFNLNYDFNWLGIACGTIAIFSGLYLVVGGLITAAYYSERHECGVWAHRNNYEYNYSMLGDGCQVKIQGQWIASENVIVTDERE